MWKWLAIKPKTGFSMEEVKIATMKDMQEALRWHDYGKREAGADFTAGVLAAVAVIEEEIKKLE